MSQKKLILLKFKLVNSERKNAIVAEKFQGMQSSFLVLNMPIAAVNLLFNLISGNYDSKEQSDPALNSKFIYVLYIMAFYQNGLHMILIFVFSFSFNQTFRREFLFLKEKLKRMYCLV